MSVIAFDSAAAHIAANLQKQLKMQRSFLDKADLFIAATAKAHDLQLATLNRKHFERVEGLTIIGYQ